MNQIDNLDELKEHRVGPTLVGAGNELIIYTPTINGIIESMELLGGNPGEGAFAVTVCTSGTNELITTFNQNSADELNYPFTYGETNQNLSGSPWTRIKKVVSEPLFISGTGSDPVHSISGVIIKFRG